MIMIMILIHKDAGSQMLPVFASSSSSFGKVPQTGEMDAEEGEVNVRDMDHADRVISATTD